MIQTGLFNLLKTIPSIGNRVYPLVAPQNTTTPYITYQRISSFDTSTTEGTESLDLARFQIKVFSKTYSDAVNNANLVKEKLSGKGLKLMHGEDIEPDTLLFFQILDYQLSDDILQ